MVNFSFRTLLTVILLLLFILSVLISRTNKVCNYYISGVVLHLEQGLGFSLSPIKKLYDVSINLDSVELFDKAKDKDYLAVSRLLSLGANANAINFAGDTLLIFAVKQKDASLVKLLLNNNVNTDIKNSEKSSALHYAINANDIGIIEILLNSGADINLRDDFENTPLITSASKQNTALMLALLARNPKKDLQDEQGQTALFHATSQDNEKLVALLLDSGANHKIVNHSGITISSIVKKGGKVEALFKQRGLLTRVNEIAPRQETNIQNNSKELFTVRRVEPKGIPKVKEEVKAKSQSSSRSSSSALTGVRAKSRPKGVWVRRKNLVLESVSVTLRNYGGVEAKNIKAKVRIPGGSFVNISGPTNLGPYSEALYSASPGADIQRNGKLKAFVSCDNCH